MRHFVYVWLVLGFMSTGTGLAVQNQAPAVKTHPFSVHDMLAMDRISDSRVSPDGKWIVFNVRETDLEGNRGRTDIWIVGTDGKDLRRLTSHPAADFNARWSPIGKCLYLPLHPVGVRPGLAHQYRRGRGRADHETASRRRQPYRFSGRGVPGRHHGGFPGRERRGDRQEARGHPEQQSPPGRIYEKLFVRHWDTWNDGRRSHLFVVPTQGGEARDLMLQMDADTPSKPFGGAEEIAFTADGKGLVFTARDAGREEAWSTDFDLYEVPVDGSRAPRCLTEANKAWDAYPRLFSRWKDAGLPGHGPSRLRGRPFPDRAQALARRQPGAS